ncbi:STAS domain-containing protein [Nocardia yamanashiensis]|uniref:STAS domain-containing protein n=1 Tax=Nocardia yamanashiensis TaxID=209247 RepID=UPI000834E046|nr:STAS domain-containing protein [Nocardia yamanashiensis]
MSAIAVLQRGVEADAIASGAERDRPEQHSPPVTDPAHSCAVVRVEGELDAAVLPEFTEALERAMTSGSAAVVVDFRQTSFLSIGGASALAGAKESAEAVGVELRVVACRREIERVLEVTGVRPLFRYHSSVQAALEA